MVGSSAFSQSFVAAPAENEIIGRITTYLLQKRDLGIRGLRGRCLFPQEVNGDTNVTRPGLKR